MYSLLSLIAKREGTHFKLLRNRLLLPHLHPRGLCFFRFLLEVGFRLVRIRWPVGLKDLQLELHAQELLHA